MQNLVIPRPGVWYFLKGVEKYNYQASWYGPPTATWPLDPTTFVRYTDSILCHDVYPKFFAFLFATKSRCGPRCGRCRWLAAPQQLCIHYCMEDFADPSPLLWGGTEPPQLFSRFFLFCFMCDSVDTSKRISYLHPTRGYDTLLQFICKYRTQITAA